MDYDDYAALLEATAADLDRSTASDTRPDSSRWEIDQLLTQAQAAERQRITTELVTIADQLNARTALHENLIHELERERDQYEDRLAQLTRQFASPDRTARPQARLRELSHERRQERRQHWRDRQQLLAERRDLQRQLAELDDEVLTRLL